MGCGGFWPAVVAGCGVPEGKGTGRLGPQPLPAPPGGGRWAADARLRSGSHHHAAFSRNFDVSRTWGKGPGEREEAAGEGAGRGAAAGSAPRGGRRPGVSGLPGRLTSGEAVRLCPGAREPALLPGPPHAGVHPEGGHFFTLKSGAAPGRGKSWVWGLWSSSARCRQRNEYRDCRSRRLASSLPTLSEKGDVNVSLFLGICGLRLLLHEECFTRDKFLPAPRPTH